MIQNGHLAALAPSVVVSYLALIQKDTKSLTAIHWKINSSIVTFHTPFNVAYRLIQPEIPQKADNKQTYIYI